jgi:uncharacterized protein YukE
MADWGREILDGSTFRAWGHGFGALATFREYLDKLNEYRDRLQLCGVDFTALPGKDKGGKYWEVEYHQEDDINLKAFRDNAQALTTASTQAAAQLDLIRQTEDLQAYWQGQASRAALHSYLTDSTRLEQDRAHLAARSQDVAQVARNLEATLTSKAQDASNTVSNLINQALGNNLADFDTRLRTACEAMEANNQGGSGPFGLGTNQHRYIPHGGSGANWSAADVRNDIQNNVISGFGYAFNALDKSNYATEEHLRTTYQTLLTALDDQNGPPDTPTQQTPTPTTRLSPAEQEQVAQWSQYSLPNGGGDCSRWAVASALANKFGVREGPNGKEINLPPDIQNAMMGGLPLHFPPAQSEINQLTRKQGVTPAAPGGENDGFPGGPDVMSSQLRQYGLHSDYHTAATAEQLPALVDQMTSDLRAGRSAIVNGAPQPGGGHFLSVTGITTGPTGETMFLVNDSNRVSDGSANGGTIPYPCTREQLTEFLRNRTSAGPAGYSTIE